MIEHRMAIVLSFVLLLMRSASWGQDDREGEQVNHTGNTQPSDASFHYWTGPIKQDTTWRDTVYVSGDVTIASGATLTLAPDTKVHFLPYRDDTQGGLDSTRAELIVEGRLHAQAEGIVFCSADAASLGADWYGIVVERGGLADISNATLRDGLRCLYAKRGGRVRMDYVAFANCGKPTIPSLSQRSAASNSTQVDDGRRASGQRKLQVQPAQAQTMLEDSLMKKKKHLPEREDSLVVERMRHPLMKKEKNLLVLKKLIAGTSTSALSALFVGGQIKARSERENVRTAFVLGLAYGTMIGFPMGVSKVDPHDSFTRTLIGGLLGGMPGIAMMTYDITSLGLFTALIGPVIGSMYASEKWHKPPRSRRVSFGLVSPHLLNGGLSAVTTLRF